MLLFMFDIRLEYTPVQIGDTTVGVRIAIRDMKQTESGRTESQIYNWGIKKAPTLDGGSPEKTSLSADVSSAEKKGASLDGARRLPSDGSIPGGVSSEASETSVSTTSIPTTAQNVKFHPIRGVWIEITSSSTLWKLAARRAPCGAQNSKTYF